MQLPKNPAARPVLAGPSSWGLRGARRRPPHPTHVARLGCEAVVTHERVFGGCTGYSMSYLGPHPFPNPCGKGTVTSGVCGGLGARISTHGMLGANADTHLEGLCRPEPLQASIGVAARCCRGMGCMITGLPHGTMHSWWGTALAQQVGLWPTTLAVPGHWIANKFCTHLAHQLKE